MIAGLKEILRAAAEEEFVGMHPQLFIEDRLPGDKFFVHADIRARRSGPFPLCFHGGTLPKESGWGAVGKKAFCFRG